MANSFALSAGVLLMPGGDVRFDRTDRIRYRDCEVELMFFDDMGPEPIAFIVRQDAPEGMEKYKAFVVESSNPGPAGDILRTTQIWRDGYFNIMPLQEFLEKTLGK